MKGNKGGREQGIEKVRAEGEGMEVEMPETTKARGNVCMWKLRERESECEMKGNKGWGN